MDPVSTADSAFPRDDDQIADPQTVFQLIIQPFTPWRPSLVAVRFFCPAQTPGLFGFYVNYLSWAARIHYTQVRLKIRKKSICR